MTSTLHPSPAVKRHLPFTLLAVATVTQLMMSTAHAQMKMPMGSAMDSGYWLFGIGAGQTRGEFDELSLGNRNSSTLPANAATNFSIATDRRDAGGKAFVGRQFNRYLGMELGYFNLGKFGWQTTTTPAGTLTGEVRAQGVNVDLVGTVPLTTNLSALGRVGATYARTRSEYDSSGVVNVLNRSPSERKTQLKLGLGLQYAFNDYFQMRAEAEEYRIADALGGRGKVKMYSVNFVFPFGRSEQPAARTAYVAPVAAAEPAPRVEPTVMVATPPAPMVAPAAAPLAPAVVPLRRVSYAAESMFGFGASAVRPEGKTALDSFTTELSGTQYDNIKVEGHTDRLGSTEFNQTLSEQRAEAVKDYLVRVRGLSAGKVSAVGMGEGMPVSKTEDCKGKAANAKLIACLQPDRRVDIEVSGTR
jgi:OmpA-OmpF porin, OOP family